MDESELGQLVDAFAEQLKAGLGSRSRWALKTALGAADVDGIDLVLEVVVPAKKRAGLDLRIKMEA